MQNRRLALFTAVGLAAAIAVPTIAFGNARRSETNGSLHYLKSAQTPLLARLTGAAETGGGDPDGIGAAAITFDIIQPAVPDTGAQVCWDLTYSGLTGTPTAAHIHRGIAGASGPIVVLANNTSFPNLGASSATGCAAVDPTLAQEIMDTPSNFYVNVHTSDFGAGAIRGQLAAGPAPAGEAHLLPLPLRAYDSRLNAGPKIQPGQTRLIPLTSGFDLNNVSVMALPPGATAAIITLTLADTDAPGGFLTIYSAAATQPATSSVNWKAAAQDIAVGTQVAVDGTGSVRVTDGVGGAATHFIIDVVGYYY